MSSFYFGGKIKLNVENNKERNDLNEYPFKLPNYIYLDGEGENYYPQVDFSWSDDSIIIKKENLVIKYTRHNFTEIKAIDKDGNVIWVDGTDAPYEGCWDGHYLDERRHTYYYLIEEYNFNTKEHKSYKVLESQSSINPLKDSEILEYFSEKCSKSSFLDSVKKNPEVLASADESFKKDKEIVLAAVTKDGIALYHADESLKKDKEVVLAAVTQNGGALEYADESFKKDKEIVLAAVTQNGRALYHADESFKKDKEIVLAAVTQNGRALEYADESFKKDKEIVLAAVTQNGIALEYADESLKKDKEIILAAVTQNGIALYHADESLKKDKEIVLAAENNNDYVDFVDSDIPF